jgi:hypothetical protein
VPSPLTIVSLLFDRPLYTLLISPVNRQNSFLFENCPFFKSIKVARTPFKGTMSDFPPPNSPNSVSNGNVRTQTPDSKCSSPTPKSARPHHSPTTQDQSLLLAQATDAINSNVSKMLQLSAQSPQIKDKRSRVYSVPGTLNEYQPLNFDTYPPPEVSRDQLSRSINQYPSHCHSDEQKPEMDKVARRKLIIASLLCLLFMIFETVGGYLANSLAIASDAAHLLTDLASFMISLFSIWLAHQPASKKMSFGYYRAEVIGALTSVLMIWVVTGILVLIAVQRLMSGNYEVDAFVMLITASFGVLVNIV